MRRRLILDAKRQGGSSGMSTKRFFFSLFVSILLLAPASSMHASTLTETVCGFVRNDYYDEQGRYIIEFRYACWEEITVVADPLPPDPLVPPGPLPDPNPNPGG